jgi:hypothetical protein
MKGFDLFFIPEPFGNSTSWQAVRTLDNWRKASTKAKRSGFFSEKEPRADSPLLTRLHAGGLDFIPEI